MLMIMIIRLATANNILRLDILNSANVYDLTL